MEITLIPTPKQVKLAELEPGTLFKFNQCVALKSEYRTDKGACECYIVGSGEFFAGGCSGDIEKLNNLMVTPLLYIG